MAAPSDLFPYVYSYLQNLGFNKTAKTLVKECKSPLYTVEGPGLVEFYEQYRSSLVPADGAKKDDSDPKKKSKKKRERKNDEADDDDDQTKPKRRKRDKEVKTEVPVETEKPKTKKKDKKLKKSKAQEVDKSNEMETEAAAAVEEVTTVEAAKTKTKKKKGKKQVVPEQPPVDVKHEQPSKAAATDDGEGGTEAPSKKAKLSNEPTKPQTKETLVTKATTKPKKKAKRTKSPSPETKKPAEMEKKVSSKKQPPPSPSSDRDSVSDSEDERMEVVPSPTGQQVLSDIFAKSKQEKELKKVTSSESDSDTPAAACGLEVMEGGAKKDDEESSSSSEEGDEQLPSASSDVTKPAEESDSSGEDDDSNSDSKTSSKAKNSKIDRIVRAVNDESTSSESDSDDNNERQSNNVTTPIDTSKIAQSTPNPASTKKTKKKETGVPYKRITDDVEVDSRLVDNSFEAKAGARGSWGEKANKDFKFVKGKTFRHEKTKKKRGTYRGGNIDTSVNSIKFDSD